MIKRTFAVGMIAVLLAISMPYQKAQASINNDGDDWQRPFCDIEERIAPTITLLGDATINLFVGDTFVDPKATAHDSQDGDITAHIVITGSVDTSVVGTTTLTYSITNSCPLTASVSRDVVVKPVVVIEQPTTTTPPEPPTPPVVNQGWSVATPAAPSVGQVLGTSTTATSSSPCLPLLTHYIKFGINNDETDVKNLQQFLNENLGLTLPITGFYNQASFDAVKSFQVKYSSDVLVPWVAFGLQNPTAATGYVYKTTFWKINSLHCAAIQTPKPQLP